MYISQAAFAFSSICNIGSPNRFLTCIIHYQIMLVVLFVIIFHTTVAGRLYVTPMCGGYFLHCILMLILM